MFILTRIWRSRRRRRIERLRPQASTLRPEVRTAVRDSPIAEIVAVAERAEYRNSAAVDAVRTAAVTGRSRPAELLPQRYVGSRVRVRAVTADMLYQRHSDHDDDDDVDSQRTLRG